MANTAPQQGPAEPSRTQGTVADVMRKPLTTVDLNDHVAAAAYLMRHAGATALIVVDGRNNQPIGIITGADITRAVADGKDMNQVRIRELMTGGPTVIDAATSIMAAARLMTSGGFRHLPVVGEGGVTGVVDISDVCRALIDPAFAVPPG